MLYYLFQYFREQYDLIGAGVFEFITFRAGMAIIMSLIISLVFGGKLIEFLQKKQIKETVRDLGLAGEAEKQGTPTMGGLIILLAILVPTLLLTQLHNIYIILMIVVTVWLAIIGFIDDYIKVFKQNKAGLAAKTKLIGQCGVGLIVGLTMYFHEDVVIRKDITNQEMHNLSGVVKQFEVPQTSGKSRKIVDYHSPITNVPFFKNVEFNYDTAVSWLGSWAQKMGWIIYVPFITLIVMFISNGANLTDGMDGLATGISAIIAVTLGILAYLSGNAISANYLNILHLPGTGELVVFIAALIGACIGFLWYNSYPAKVFMGDTGSLALGGIIATICVLIRKEILIPIICGVFIIENLSVMIQVGYFKYTKSKYGEGKRVFLMAPLHHHYQKKGMHESKIVVRFWIVGLTLAVLTFITLKLR